MFTFVYREHATILSLSVIHALDSFLFIVHVSFADGALDRVYRLCSYPSYLSVLCTHVCALISSTQWTGAGVSLRARPLGYNRKYVVWFMHRASVSTLTYPVRITSYDHHLHVSTSVCYTCRDSSNNFPSVPLLVCKSVLCAHCIT